MLKVKKILFILCWVAFLVSIPKVNNTSQKSISKNLVFCVEDSITSIDTQNSFLPETDNDFLPLNFLQIFSTNYFVVEKGSYVTGRRVCISHKRKSAYLLLLDIPPPVKA